MISICVPSRKRPNKIRALLKSIRETSGNSVQVETLFYLDEDDLVTIEATIIEEFPDLLIRFFRCKPTEISGDRYNFLLSKSAGDILMYGSDDTAFLKSNWNVDVQQIFDSISDKIALVFSPDIIHGNEIPTHGFVSKRSTEILGYLFYPYFRTWYNDVWLAGLYKPLNRYYPVELGIVHQHFSQGYGSEDETYLKQNIKDLEGLSPIDRDHRTWAIHKSELPNDMEKLRSVINV